jgi:hypothetical protein
MVHGRFGIVRQHMRREVQNSLKKKWGIEEATGEVFRSAS